MQEVLLQKDIDRFHISQRCIDVSKGKADEEKCEEQIILEVEESYPWKTW